MMHSEQDKTSSRSLYQRILSAKEPSCELAEQLNTLLRRSLSTPEHFDFLLHRVSWFSPPLTHYPLQLLRLLRLYGGQSKHSAKVIYNLLIQSMSQPHAHSHALTALTQLYTQTYDRSAVLSSLKDNYPHKLCPLQMHQLYIEGLMSLGNTTPERRTDMLEMVVESLVKFDTEVVEGDSWVHQPYPDDLKIVALRQQARNNPLAEKLDNLLHQFVGHMRSLSDQKQLLSEMLLVFQNKILPIKTTKMVQLLVLAMAETSRQTASTFTSFLLSNIFDEKQKENSYRIFTQSNFYLGSYLARSKKLSGQAITKVIGLIMARLGAQISQLKTVEVDENTNLKELFFANQRPLMILQTLLMIITQRPDAGFDRQAVTALIKEASVKLHFQYFIREEILSKLDIPRKEGEGSLQLKFSNKFLPSTIPLTAQLTDPIMRLPDLPPPIPQDVRNEQPACRKLHKGETPISHCSQTVI